MLATVTPSVSIDEEPSAEATAVGFPSWEGGKLVIVRQFAKLDLDGLLLAATPDQDVDRLADGRLGDDPRQATHAVDLLAVKPQDDIAGLDRRHLRRAPGRNAGDKGAARFARGPGFRRFLR